MLAQVTHDFLDSAMKMENQEEGIRLLTSIVTLMSCLEEKDKYLFYLSANFSKRLLDSDIDSINCLEWEKQLVLIIKAKLGAEFSKNLEAMIADVEHCYEKKEAIREHFAKTSNQNLIKTFHVNVLSNCEWTLPNLPDISPSDNVVLVQRIFEEMFVADPLNLNKRLEWNYALGSMELKFNFQDKEFTVICKPYHYFVLQLFSAQDKLTLNDISIKLKLANWISLVPVVEALVLLVYRSWPVRRFSWWIAQTKKPRSTQPQWSRSTLTSSPSPKGSYFAKQRLKRRPARRLR